MLAMMILITTMISCSSAPTPTPMPTVWPTITLPRPTAAPTKSVEQVMAAVKSSAHLDRVHLDKGMTCQTCHDPFPPQAQPSTEKCFSCHKATYDELAKTTVRLEPRNPHKSHLGAEPCTTCHGVHKPFVYHCSSCHVEWTYAGRYATK
jgi:hypothetical protein